MSQRERPPQGDPLEPRGSGLYPRRLEPAALPGDLIAIKSTDEVRRVQEVVAQPGITAFQDGVDVNAGAESTDHELDALELPDNFAGQFRLVHPGDDIPTDVRFLFDLGAQNAQAFATNNQRGFWDHETATEEAQDTAGNTVTSDLLNLHLHELYTFEQQDIYVTFNHTNSGGAQQTIQDVRFTGFIYRLSEPLGLQQGRQPVPWPNGPVVPKSQ